MRTFDNRPGTSFSPPPARRARPPIPMSFSDYQNEIFRQENSIQIAHFADVDAKQKAVATGRALRDLQSELTQYRNMYGGLYGR